MLTSIALLASHLLFIPGDEPEWGGFRGNNGAGIAESTALPEALDPEHGVRWRTEVPAGYSSPVVSGDVVFLTAADREKLWTLCIDRGTGVVRWRQGVEFDGKRPGANSPAAPSPVTDGEHVYVLFHSFGLIAYDLEGRELWRRPLGPFNIPHGMASSPLLHSGRLVLVVDQDTDSYAAAYDKASGKELWKVARPGVTHGYSTPTIFTPEEGPSELIVSGSLQVSAYSLEDGKKLWWVDGSAWQTKATPVIADGLCLINAFMVPSSEFGIPKTAQTWEQLVAERDADGDGKISRKEWVHQQLNQAWFIFDLDGDDLLDAKDYAYLQAAGTATGGLFAVELGGSGNVTESHVKWRIEDSRGLPDAPSPLAIGGTLFLIKDGGVLTSLDASSGELAKQGRIGKPDDYYASPVAAAGKLICASKSGQLTVIRADAEWEVLSVRDLGEDVWSTPAIAGGQVFVRSQEALYCFE